MTLAERLRRCFALLGAGRRAVLVLHVDEAELEAKRAAVATLVNVQRDPEGGPFACPCCASLTLPTRGQYELCPVCFREDEGQDDHDADLVRPGPNGSLSLTQARANYAALGACDRASLHRVRSPTPQERPTR
ncbi:Cysteine-rich CPCC [Modestobacter sp. DSM 44400]|uniref:CPCC family cysteine-rich protein n=1 Tax=Modestobacter sp. DSM 44400 TaxID=1550230 RepID=UPI00089D837E|nr:Cysteine-rich CPCC [Modestobacter sp. DSM 44400]